MVPQGFKVSGVEKAGARQTVKSGLFSVCGKMSELSLMGRQVFDYAVVVLHDEQLSSEQIAALRAMSGQKRMHLAEQLYWFARKVKAAGLRNQYPDWPENRVTEEVTRIFIHART